MKTKGTRKWAQRNKCLRHREVGLRTDLRRRRSPRAGRAVCVPTYWIDHMPRMPFVFLRAVKHVGSMFPAVSAGVHYGMIGVTDVEQIGAIVYSAHQAVQDRWGQRRDRDLARWRRRTSLSVHREPESSSRPADRGGGEGDILSFPEGGGYGLGDGWTARRPDFVGERESRRVHLFVRRRRFGEV